MLKALMGIVLALAMTACATTNNKSNYETYVKSTQQMHAENAVAANAASVAKAQQYAALRDNCTTDACVTNVAAFQSIADIVASLGGAGSRTPVLAAPQREPTLSEQALSWASVLIPGVSTYVGITETNKTQRHLSDNQTAERQSQNSMWSTIFTQQSAAATALADKPNIVVGGNYGNTTTTTNSAGNNLVSGDDNLIGDRNNNSGRQDAPGPYDNSGNCRDGDANCPVTQPDPTP